MKKTVIVTGGTRGIGKAIALAFAERGYAVAACYEKDQAAAEELRRAFKARDALFVVEQADVSRAADMEQFLSRALSLTGKIDVLVNNAGIAQYGLFQKIGEADFDRLFAVNCKGVYLAIKGVLPHMISEQRGSIVNVSSVWGAVGASCEAAYSASKAWVIGLTRALAKEVGPSGIAVNCVCPGVIDTEMNAHLTAEDRAALVEETPLGRMGLPADVARLVCSLAEDGFITGQIVSTDGGFSL